MDSIEYLCELEAIRRLKHAYLRCLDMKLYDEMRDLFLPDATSSYNDRRYSFSGRDGIVDFLRRTMGRPDLFSSHRATQPEIDFTGPGAATAIWAFEDRVIDSAPGHEVTIRGAGFYRDEYRKCDDGWKISHTGYVRTFAEIESRAGDARAPRLTATTQGVLRPPAGPGR